MSSETITRNDLMAILNEVLPTAAADYIVEQGTSGIWTYRKWNSGIAECWGTRASVSVNFNTWVTSWYYGYFTGISLPFTFAEIPVVMQHCSSSGGDIYATGASVENAGGQATTTNTGGTVVFRGQSKSGVPVSVRYYVIGKWK